MFPQERLYGSSVLREPYIGEIGMVITLTIMTISINTPKTKSIVLALNVNARPVIRDAETARTILGQSITKRLTCVKY